MKRNTLRATCAACNTTYHTSTNIERTPSVIPPPRTSDHLTSPGHSDRHHISLASLSPSHHPLPLRIAVSRFFSAVPPPFNRIPRGRLPQPTLHHPVVPTFLANRPAGANRGPLVSHPASTPCLFCSERRSFNHQSASHFLSTIEQPTPLSALRHKDNLLARGEPCLRPFKYNEDGRWRPPKQQITAQRNRR